MQYNPTVADRSGEILGQGQSNASMLQMQGMQGMGQDLGAAIASLAGSYAKGRADQAKAKAYTEFLDMHGETLGVQPEWLEEFRKKKPQEQLAMGDLLVGSMLPHQQRMAYLQKQHEMYGQRQTANPNGDVQAAGPSLMDFNALGANPNLNFE